MKKNSTYNLIMQKVVLTSRKGNQGGTTYKAINKAINRLPTKEKAIVLAKEDERNMASLNKKHKKSTDYLVDSSVLLLTQAIIELAIADRDEDFFMSNYGKAIVDGYNTALTIYTKHNYNITAELLLEKMRKGEIVIESEEIRRRV